MAQTDDFDPTHALDGWRAPGLAALDLQLRPLPGGGGALDGATADAEGFDAIHALDGWRAPAPAPLDLQLGSLRTAGAGPDAAKLERLKARGYEMLDVEDIELAAPPVPRPSPTPVVEAGPHADGLPDKPLQGRPPAASDAPVLDFRAPPPRPQPDPQQFIDAVELPAVPAPPAVVETPVLDMPAPARPAEPDPRLLAQWQPLAWSAQVRCLAGASAEVVQTPGGLSVENHAPEWLCALWPPGSLGRPQLDRWPHLAAIVAADTAGGALEQLLGELPPEAGLWSADLGADWGLIAELVLHQDTGLRAAQTRALRELAESERQADVARMNVDYLTEGRFVRRQP